MLREDFLKHPIWAKLDEIDVNISSLITQFSKDERVASIKKLASYLRWNIEKSDPELLSQDELNRLIGVPIQQIIAHTAGNANNLNHLANIETQFGHAFGILPYPRFKRILKSDARDLVDELRGQLDTLKAAIDKVNSELSTKADEFVGKTNDVDTSLNAMKEEIAALNNEITAKISELEASQNTQISEKIVEFSERFSKAQSTRSDEYQEFKNSASEELAKLETMKTKVFSENQKQIKEANENLTIEQGKFVKAANKTLEDLKKVYDQAGQTALASGFSGGAVEENKQFKTYSKWASVFFIGAAIIVAWNVIQLFVRNDYSISLLLKNLPISFVLLLPAFYFASLANDHRKSSVKLRSLGLRIQAFDAYIVNSETDDRNQLKKDLAKEFFEEKVVSKESKGFFERKPSETHEEIIELAKTAINKIPSG